ncbi:ninjurin-A-like isoform X4 [Drosophila sulfurigaster albostrigata]|uniref:ninjurin-A-like isoform X4 n=1 Tax=Drosophila sulfurigaster albostrigata TaxID=89887 RepID=UPI002D21E276|nr:ninjurin-A-like isoform X4 [Drosophila sulfurigaster albostrigata]
MSKIFRKKGKRKGADKSQANDKTADLLVDKEEQGIFKGGATSPDLNNKTADLLVDKEKQEKYPDLNVYQSRKTLAQGMMDLALLSANANQLRHVLETETKSAYFFISLSLISLSIIFQIGVGVGLIWNYRYDIKKEEDISRANRINNYTVIGIFIVTVVNVIIPSFFVSDSPGPQNGTTTTRQ